MPQSIKFDYRFHPVGQGLFTSGSLYQEPPSRDSFNWVFDCGSTAPKRDLKPHVNNYKEHILNDNIIDILCLSHFDYDHVSGLTQLLDSVHVKTIVIPYYAEHTRLAILAMQWAHKSRSEVWNNYINFISNPISFLSKFGIERIVVITYKDAGGNTDIYPYDKLDNDPNNKKSDRGDKSEERVWKTRPDEGVDYVNGEGKVKDIFIGRAIEECKLYAEINNSTVWEFLFYHKPLEVNNIELINSRICSLLKRNKLGLAECLMNKKRRDNIKKIYKRIFKTSHSFNSHGISMYAGPVQENRCDIYRNKFCMHNWTGIIPESHLLRLCRCFCPCCCDQNGVSAMYTGDCDYNRDYVDGLAEYLTDTRMEKLAVLQVPHHGSQHNWDYEYNFSHTWSIFCADPDYKYHHPHDVVVINHLVRGHIPVLVDKHTGCTFHGSVDYT